MFFLSIISILILQLINQAYIPIPTMLFVFLFVCMFLLCNKEQILGVYLYLILLSSGYLLYLTNVLFVIFLVLKFRRKLSINNSFIFILIIILIESLHVFVNNNLGIDESFIKLLGFSICLIPFAFVKSFSNYINIKQTFNLFVFGFIGFTLITLNIYINDYGLGNYFTEIRRFGFMPNQVENEINGILINPNTIGKYAALIISVYLILFSYKKIKLNLLNITLLLYTMLIGFLTLSRTFLLLMFIILFIYMIVNFRMKNKFMNIFLLLSIFIGSLIIFMNDNLRQSIYNRVFETDDISGSRLLIYNQYIGIIREHANVLLIGTGMQDYSSKFTKYNDQIYQSAHNVFLEIISIWGIIGLATIILFTIFLVFESNIKKIRSNTKKTLILLPLLTILISAQFGQYFISYYHTFSVTIFSLLFLYSSEVIDE